MKKVSLITFTLCALMLPSIFCMKTRKRFSPKNLRRSNSPSKSTDIYSELRAILNSSAFDWMQFLAVEDKVYAQNSLTNYKIYLGFLVSFRKKIKENDKTGQFEGISSSLIPLLIAHFPTQELWMDAWLDKLGENLLDNAPITQTLLECLIDDNDSLAISKVLNYPLKKKKRNKVKNTIFLIKLFNKPFKQKSDINLFDYAMKTKKYKASYSILRFLKEKLRQNLKNKYTPKIKAAKKTLTTQWYNKFMKLITP